nr:DNA-directed RNA polymerase III subunit RPC8 [Tanacetum cinerariifolium]
MTYVSKCSFTFHQKMIIKVTTLVLYGVLEALMKSVHILLTFLYLELRIQKIRFRVQNVKFPEIPKEQIGTKPFAPMEITVSFRGGARGFPEMHGNPMKFCRVVDHLCRTGVWVRFRGGSSQRSFLAPVKILIVRDELGDEDTKEDGEDESSDANDEILTMDTAMGEPLGIGYGALRPCELVVGEDQVPSTFEVDEDQFLEVGAQLELHRGILYDKDLRKLYTRLGAVRVEIFSQRYMFRSLEREHERATVTFSAIWRLVVALEAWTGQTDAQREALWHVIYDIQRENHDLRSHIAEERCERLELTDHVARMERRQESGGE